MGDAKENRMIDLQGAEIVDAKIIDEAAEDLELTPEAAAELAEAFRESADAENAHPTGTAAYKVLETLKGLSRPDEDAGELAMTLATVAMALERSIAGDLAAAQESGELDRFLGGLVRWLASLRSDTAPRLVPVELPRRRRLPPHIRLIQLERAERLAENATSPF